jgi:hypothetical protein
LAGNEGVTVLWGVAVAVLVADAVVEDVDGFAVVVDVVAAGFAGVVVGAAAFGAVAAHAARVDEVEKPR